MRKEIKYLFKKYHISQPWWNIDWPWTKHDEFLKCNHWPFKHCAVSFLYWCKAVICLLLNRTRESQSKIQSYEIAKGEWWVSHDWTGFPIQEWEEICVEEGLFKNWYVNICV